MWAIRSADAADHAAIIKMSVGIQRAERDAIGYPMLPPDEIDDDYILAILATGSKEDGEILVAEIDGEPVGYLIGYVKMDKDHFLDADFRHHAHIADIYLEPKARRQGIAREMIRIFTERMKARGCGWMRIFSKANNLSAVKSYTAAGFEPFDITFVKKL